MNTDYLPEAPRSARRHSTPLSFTVTAVAATTTLLLFSNPAAHAQAPETPAIPEATATPEPTATPQATATPETPAPAPEATATGTSFLTSKSSDRTSMAYGATIATPTWIAVAGEVILRIPTSAGGYSPQERTSVVLQRLVPILSLSDLRPKDVIIRNDRATGGNPVLYVRNYPLITVDAALAREHKSTPEGLAERWAAHLSRVLPQASVKPAPVGNAALTAAATPPPAEAPPAAAQEAAAAPATEAPAPPVAEAPATEAPAAPAPETPAPAAPETPAPEPAAPAPATPEPAAPAPAP